MAGAAAGAPPGVGFAVHDVTAVPFPAGPADLLSCRLLLSHLAEPAAVLAAWATQLGPGGLLLVDEVERIHTADPALRGYLDVATALLASRGHTLEIGGTLHRLPDPRTWPSWPPAGARPASPGSCASSPSSGASRPAPRR